MARPFTININVGQPTLDAAWDEGKHKRDHGKFSSGGGSGGGIPGRGGGELSSGAKRKIDQEIKRNSPSAAKSTPSANGREHHYEGFSRGSMHLALHENGQRVGGKSVSVSAHEDKNEPDPTKRWANARKSARKELEAWGNKWRKGEVRHDNEGAAPAKSGGSSGPSDMFFKDLTDKWNKSSPAERAAHTKSIKV